MPKQKLKTLTIAIPAHNESANIRQVLRSIAKQKTNTFILRSIIVACDGCTDDTAAKARAFKRKLPQLKVLDDGKRLGKAGRLNQFLKLASSDFLFLLDADLLLGTSTELEKLLAPFSNPAVELVGARFQPVAQKNIFGKASVISFSAFMDAALRWNNGCNFYTLVGGAQVLRKSLAKNLYYPQGLISDQSFLFAFATQRGLHTYEVAHASTILTRTVNTFHDWRLLGTRSIGKNKSDAVQYFGSEILADYTIPKKLLLQSILDWMIREPIATIAAIALNIFIRVLPMQVAMQNGVWEHTESSKEAITN